MKEFLIGFMSDLTVKLLSAWVSHLETAEKIVTASKKGAVERLLAEKVKRDGFKKGSDNA